MWRKEDPYHQRGKQPGKEKPRDKAEVGLCERKG
jgi:hypothetical protein